MMKDNVKGHLGEDRIISALVDENDLTPSEKDHLRSCPVCSGAKQALAAQLVSLSGNAGRFTPAPQRKVLLPAEREPAGTWITGWNMGLVAAAACLVLIIGIVLPRVLPDGPLPYGKMSLAAETAADARLMAEIDSIEEHALPASLQNIIPDPGTGTDADEDVIELMTPADAG